MQSSAGGPCLFCPAPGSALGGFSAGGGGVVQDGTAESWESSTIALRTGTRAEKGLGVSS